MIHRTPDRHHRDDEAALPGPPFHRPSTFARVLAPRLAAGPGRARVRATR